MKFTYQRYITKTKNIGMICNKNTYCSTNSAKQSYRCSARSCSASLILLDDLYCEANDVHNHDCNATERISRINASNTVKSLASSTYLNSTSILCEVRSQLYNYQNINIQKNKYLRQVIRDTRKEKH